ncbi:hypothetical protein [Actinoplanes sp. DH11]|uniref:hypothetical protein n=1 Tax=Actinoplanes sp. DH11 TaxID=2857011 RepID=UPI001E51F894|nr:hypothetical protein [Actinoplanes sp. DH11]
MAADPPDPHVHVDARLGGEVVARDMLASAFGLAADLPSEVRTGCGRRVARAMTAVRPESVTCLPCREFARDAHERLAEQVETLGAMPGSTVSPEQAAAAAASHRDRAARFR